MSYSVTADDYDCDIAKKFCNDMKKTDYEPEHYHGRFYWEGPAVRCYDPDSVRASTSVPIITDQMGLGYIAHPIKSAKLKNPQEV